jgi:serine/threonine protein kinase/Tol biopolymer transport system component
MALTSGTKLGPYEIQSPLGAGGMGEVYRARDTRLDRIVAIKVLASHLSSSPELKQRMEREARAISSLNHPHICHLYDIGSQDGTDFLVMEFLEGETLADRLRKGAMPLNEVYKIGIAIAEALAVAHRQGIVHRDLKPGNIMLTQGGAKLMDFGLAKPLGVQTVASGTVPSFTALPTMSGPSPMTPLTTAGSIVGTIQYMSPEQIEGKEADARSDIFAFGAVLYEMAAGKRPFEGKSQISLASAILEKEPESISALKPQVPTALEHVVTTCLQKNPEERYQTAHDIKLELQWIARERPAPATTAVAPAPAPSPLGWVAAVMVGLLLGSVAGFLLHRPSSPAVSMRTVIDPPPGAAFRLTDDAGGPPVISPDGSTLAFTATDQQGKNGLWVRPMNSVEARALAGTDDAIFPFWSPDSRSLGFFVNGKLKTIDVNGGSGVVVCDALLGRGGAWAASGVIVFSPGPIGPLVRVNANGGNPVEVTKIDTHQHSSHRWPFFLPDGKHFLYLALNHDRAQSGNDAIYYASLDGRENRLLLRTQSSAVYAGGFLLFVRGDQLMAQAFDPANGTLSGDPQGVAKGVISDATTWHTDASAADNGLLVFGSGGSGDVQLVWLDRKGNQIGVAADKFTSLRYAQISPQGDRVALQIDTGTNDIWVLDPARGVRTRLTFGPVSNNVPVWSADGKWIAYFSLRDGKSTIYRKASDGSGAEELLVTDERGVVPTDWSRDGKTLLYQRGPLGGPFDMWLLPLEGERKPRMLLAHAGDGLLSPDGHWLAYDSIESGSPEVYVVPFGGGAGKWQVSPSGGGIPQWSGDGKELYYLDATSSIQAVTVKQAGGALQFSAPQTLVSRLTILSIPFFSVTPDGKKILVSRVAQQVSPSVTVVTNFTEGLKK